jgi:glyoxylase-like metal-dependent hydrolase (beta-lactamase superfamily II)
MTEQKRSHRVGDAVVTRIPELLLRSFKTTDLIPDWRPGPADHYVRAMVPDCLDAALEHVVISTHGWLVRTPRHTIIVDTAVGNGKPRAAAAFDHLQSPWLEQLAAAGVEPEAVDFVLLTHLHTDHVGWNTRLVDGRWVPTFPSARYVVPQGEQDRLAALVEAHGPDTPRTVFYADSVLPVIEGGQVSFVGADGGEPVEGFVFHPTPGHSAGHMSVGLASGGAYGFFPGDVMHHPIQIYRPEWSSVFSDSPERGRASREWALSHMADTGALVFSSHFPGSSAGRVSRTANGFRWTFA